MTWRTIMITKHCKLSYKNNYLIVRDDTIEMLHLSEIHTVIIDSTMVSVTSYLINELMKNKIKVIFCDEKRNPICEVIPYYGKYNCTKSSLQQIHWNKTATKRVWTRIIKEKIENQAKHLQKYDIPSYLMLVRYSDELKLYDKSNREGHAAKVYFNSLFGSDFSRELDNDINIALNYGYAILLSTFNKEIVASGYLTQFGIKHKNEFNYFNLSCDLMEPFRILIDEIVYENKEEIFSGGYKEKLVDVLNKQVMIGKQKQFLTKAISIYIRSVITAIENNDPDLIVFFTYT